MLIFKTFLVIKVITTWLLYKDTKIQINIRTVELKLNSEYLLSDK
jgi:hypothetical protein